MAWVTDAFVEGLCVRLGRYDSHFGEIPATWSTRRKEIEPSRSAEKLVENVKQFAIGGKVPENTTIYNSFLSPMLRKSTDGATGLDYSAWQCGHKLLSSGIHWLYAFRVACVCACVYVYNLNGAFLLFSQDTARLPVMEFAGQYNRYSRTCVGF